METRGLTSVEWEERQRQQAEESARRQAKILCIAQMAATLKAGHMANAWSELKDVSAREFALLAQNLYNAVEEVESNLPPQSEARV